MTYDEAVLRKAIEKAVLPQTKEGHNGNNGGCDEFERLIENVMTVMARSRCYLAEIRDNELFLKAYTVAYVHMRLYTERERARQREERFKRLESRRARMRHLKSISKSERESTARVLRSAGSAQGTRSKSATRGARTSGSRSPSPPSQHERRERCKAERDLRRQARALSSVEGSRRLRLEQMHSSLKNYVFRLRMAHAAHVEAHAAGKPKRRGVTKCCRQMGHALLRCADAVATDVFERHAKASANTVKNLCTGLLSVVNAARHLAMLIERVQVGEGKNGGPSSSNGRGRANPLLLTRNQKSEHFDSMMGLRRAKAVYGKLSEMMRIRLNPDRGRNRMPMKAKKKYVSMEEVHGTCDDYRSAAEEALRTLRQRVQYVGGSGNNASTSDAKQSLQPRRIFHNLRALALNLAFFSVAAHLPPKRADLGNVLLFVTTQKLASQVVACTRQTVRSLLARRGAAPCVKVERNSKRSGENTYNSETEALALRGMLSAMENPTSQQDDGSALFVLFSKGDPRRADNKINSNHVKEKKNSLVLCNRNFLVLDREWKKSFLVLQVYKTAQRYSTFVEQLPERLHTDILLSLQLYPRRFLLVQQRSDPLRPLQAPGYENNNSYTQMFIRNFRSHFNGRGMGCSMLRHVFVTEKIDPGRLTVREQRDFAKRMLHSHVQQMEYRWVNTPSRSSSNNKPSSNPNKKKPQKQKIMITPRRKVKTE